MYKVIRFFTDLQDNDHAYNVGDVFPREGMTVNLKRYKELAGPDNKQGTPLIEEVPEKPVADDVAALEAQEDSVAETKEPATYRRSTRKKNKKGE